MNSFIAPIVALVLFLLFFTSTRLIKPIEKDGFKIFRPNILIGIIGGFSVALCLFILFAFAFGLFGVKLSDALIIGGLFALMGLPLLLMQFNLRICINEDSIIYRNLFGKTKKINFGEIKSIKGALGSYNELIIKSNDNIKIRISPVYSGYTNMIQILKEKAPFSKDVNFI